jgi:hypothetical protein
MTKTAKRLAQDTIHKILLTSEYQYISDKTLNAMDYRDFQNEKFDQQLFKIKGLKWSPWIGKRYDETNVLVLGESQYEDGDDWQEDNIESTRILIGKRFSGSRGKLFTNTEKVLLALDNPTIEQGNYLWKSVVYYNLVQRLLSSIKERPSETDFDNGWAIFFDIVEVIRPSTCIVLGKSSCGRLGYYLNNNETGWERNIPEFYASEKIINLSKNGHKLKLIFINHPSGSRGFDYEYWAELVSENDPSLKQVLMNNN